MNHFLRFAPFSLLHLVLACGSSHTGAAGSSATSSNDGGDASNPGDPSAPAGPINPVIQNPNDPPVTESEFVEAFAHASCDQLAPCCAADKEVYDAQKCLDYHRDRAQKKGLDAEHASGKSYDPVGGGHCIARVREAAAVCYLDDRAIARIQQACQLPFVGGKAPGDPCLSYHECAPSPDGPVRCEQISGTDNPGSKCIVLHVAQQGEHCGGHLNQPNLPNEVSTCDRGLACDPSTSTCVPPTPDGQPCNDKTPACGDDSSCKPATGGVCTANAPAGAPCDYSARNRGCQLGTVCDGSGTCHAQQPGSDDTACASSTECKSHECDRGRCVATASAGTAVACHGDTGGSSQFGAWSRWTFE